MSHIQAGGLHWHDVIFVGVKLSARSRSSTVDMNSRRIPRFFMLVFLIIQSTTMMKRKPKHYTFLPYCSLNLEQGCWVFFSNFYYAASTFIKYFTNDVDFHIKSPITFCLIRYNITIYFLSMSDADRYLVQYSFIDSWSRSLLLDTRYCVSCVHSLFWKRYLPIPGII